MTIHVLYYRIAYFDDLQTYTYRKRFYILDFLQNTNHLKIGRFLLESVYVNLWRTAGCTYLKK